MILLSKTVAYWLITLIYLVMYSDPDHVSIAHILQHVIEQVVHAIYKVTNRIR